LGGTDGSLPWGDAMTEKSDTRVTAVLAISGGGVALVGNLLAPRINGDNVEVYRKIADSTRFAAAGVIVLAAVLLVTAAFVGITHTTGLRATGGLAYYGRLAAVVGGSLAVLQTGVELYGYRYLAKAFAGADDHNVVSAFWATNALDHLSSAMFALWTLVLLGIAPVLIGAGQLRARVRPGWVGIVAVVGGAVCAVVGIASLLHEDQSTFDVPFLIGSLLVTAWIIATGVFLWRAAPDAVVDLSAGAARPEVAAGH